MRVSPSGSVMDVKLLLQKALSPMAVTLLGTVMSLSSLQPSKALGAMAVTVAGMTVTPQPFSSVLVAVSISALQPSRES